MVPIFRDLRSKGVRCHFERSCLVVGGKRYFDPAKARTFQMEPTPHSPEIKTQCLLLSHNKGALRGDPSCLVLLVVYMLMQM